MPESWLPALDEGEYWPFQLEGCSVTTEAGRALGTLTDMVGPNPANDLWVARDDAGTETLVPALRDVIVEVDIEAKRVVVRDVPGLHDPAPGRIRPGDGGAGVTARVAGCGSTCSRSSPGSSRLRCVRACWARRSPRLVRGPGPRPPGLRDRRAPRWTTTSFGGGPGMVMKPEPVFAAVESLDPDRGARAPAVARGRRLDQALARELSAEAATLSAGATRGSTSGSSRAPGRGSLDRRLRVVRWRGAGAGADRGRHAADPRVIGQQESHEQDSFSEPHLLDHPHYTRPREFREMQVPEVLLSGNHGEIEAWRREAARDKTRRNRPDLGWRAGGVHPRWYHRPPLP